MSVKKLSEEQVAQIKKMLAEGVLQKMIAIKFGITQSDVSMIKTGNYFDKGKYQRLYLCSVSKSTYRILENIAINKGFTGYTEMMKHKVHEIIEEAPAHLKRDPDNF